MSALLNYEFRKMIRSVLWGGVTFVVFGAFFLLLGFFGGQRIEWDRTLIVQIISMLGSFGLGIIITGLFFSPVVVAVASYHKDLNGPQAVFEAYVPQRGWKRLLAKYIVYFLLILAGILLSALMAYLTYVLIRSSAPRRIQFQVDSVIAEILGGSDRFGVILTMARYILDAALGLTVTAGFFHFFITLHAVIRHKIRHAVPLTFLAGAVFGIARGWISEAVFGAQTALGQSRLAGIQAETVFEWVLFLAAFFLMSYFLDQKTELK